MSWRPSRALPVLAALLLTTLLPSCGGNDLGPLADIPAVIEAAPPSWSAEPPHTLSATVTRAGSGDAVADNVAVVVEILKVGPLEHNESFSVPASRSDSDPLVFTADAGTAAPFHPNQEIRFRWSAGAEIGGEQTELGATEIAAFHVDSDTCTSDVDSYLRAMHQTVFDRFGGITTLGEIFAEGYILNNHGYATINGMGVSFVHPNPVFQVGTPELLMFRAAPGSDLLDNTSCAATCALGQVLPPCVCQPCDSCADEPYEFVGWAYGSFAFDPDVPRPVRGCIPHHYWFLHEAGWHTGDGGMLLDPTPGAALDPPPIACPDANLMCASPDRYHPRVWDLHFWVDSEAMAAEGTSAVRPRAAIFNTDSAGNLTPTGGLAAPTTFPSDDFPEGQCMFFYTELGCDGEPD